MQIHSFTSCVFYPSNLKHILTISFPGNPNIFSMHHFKVSFTQNVVCISMLRIIKVCGYQYRFTGFLTHKIFTMFKYKYLVIFLHPVFYMVEIHLVASHSTSLIHGGKNYSISLKLQITVLALYPINILLTVIFN